MDSETNAGYVNSFLTRLAGARVIILFSFHAAVFFGCYFLAWLLRFDFAVWPEYLTTPRETALAVIGVQLLIGVFFGFYRGWWRYVGIADVVRLVAGLTTSLAILIVARYLGAVLPIITALGRVPRGVLLIDWAFALLTLFGARVAIRMGRDRMRTGESVPSSKPVLIVGAGDAGEALAREIEHRPQLGMKVAAFVDDHRAKWKSHIRGIEVMGPISEIAKIAGSFGADEALIAIPSASGKRLREIIHHLSEADLKFKTMPGIDQLVSGKVHISQLRPVNVEDLLRRKRIDLPGDPVRQLFKGKRVLVTGAGGTIGSELASQILEFEPESLALVERSEYALYECRRLMPMGRQTAITYVLGDVGDAELVRLTLESSRPQIVLHAAAHKHVPMGEENPTEYIRNNCLTARAFAELCHEAGVSRFVFISTDKAINPVSVMGVSKRAAEIALLDLARNPGMDVAVVRFGNVIGSSGSVIPLFVQQIEAGGPVTVTHPDATRYFLRTNEAVSLVLQAATIGCGGQILTLDMGEPVKIVDLANDLIRLSNRTPDEVPIVFIGLRPGEKLVEEVRAPNESVHPTIHPQILMTEMPLAGSAKIRECLRILAEQLRDNDPAWFTTIHDLVPEYLPAAATAEFSAVVPEGTFMDSSIGDRYIIH